MPAALFVFPTRDLDVNQLRSFLARGQGISSAAARSLPVNRKTLPSVAAVSALWIGASVVPGAPTAIAAQKVHKHGSASARHRVAKEMTVQRAQPATSFDAVWPSLRDIDETSAESVAHPASEDDTTPSGASLTMRIPSNDLVLGPVCATTPTMCVPLASERDDNDAHEWSGQVKKQDEGDDVAQMAKMFGDASSFALNKVSSSSGAIDSTLRASLSQAGYPASVVAQIGEIFAGHVDVDATAQAGDEYRIVMDDADESAEPRIASIEVRLNGRAYNAMWFTAPGATRGSYYTLDGTLLAGEPFAMPLNFRRVSSPFGMRVHPVFGEPRFHTGVDLTAPTGTPIYAAASGTVELAAGGHGYGKHIVLRHDDGYTTVYAHLSLYASGLKVGQRVDQGQVIGYVGRTGVATGPHLHFEVRLNNQPVDPLTLTSHQFVAPLSGAARVAFNARADAARTSLASLPTPNVRVALAYQPPRFF
jgi:murein DD-endopeptidase MepM/ murein hydrolase activator NlpD